MSHNSTQEIIEMLQAVLDSAEELPDYICNSENYPAGKTVVLEDIKLDSFDFVIKAAIDRLEKTAKHDISRRYKND